MEKAKNFNTKPKTEAMVVVAKVFSIIAALILGLAAILEAAISGEELVYMVSSWGMVPESEYQALVANLLIRIAAPMVMSALMIISALVLTLDRKGPFVFIPMGLLTYTVLASAATVLIDVVRLIFGAMGERFFSYHLPYHMLSEVLIIAVCLPIAIIVTAFLFVAAATFCKKCRFVPMIILTAILGGGFVANAVVAVLGMLARMDHYETYITFIRSATVPLMTINYFISPALRTLVVGLLFVASLFAIFGVLSAKKKPDVVENRADTEAE